MRYSGIKSLLDSELNSIFLFALTVSLASKSLHFLRNSDKIPSDCNPQKASFANFQTECTIFTKNCKKDLKNSNNNKTPVVWR